MFGDDARRPKKPLEKIPFIFRYVFTCDESACHSHTMMCADWEMASLYRNCRRLPGRVKVTTGGRRRSPRVAR
jgi:hypothetical protein